MNAEQRATYVKSQIAAAMIELEAMKAENQCRQVEGLPPAYREDTFLLLIDKYGLGHNAVLAYLAEAGNVLRQGGHRG